MTNYYEGSRKEFYEKRIHEIAEQVADLIDRGYAIEIAKSRSGIKLFSFKKRHVELKRKERVGNE